MHFTNIFLIIHPTRTVLTIKFLKEKGKMKRNLAKVFAIILLGFVFLGAFAITDKIYSSDDENSLVIVVKDAKFGEEEKIIIVEDPSSGGAGAYVNSVYPGPTPPPPDTTGGN